MSYRVYVVCEDHTLDQYIAKPIISALLSAIGKVRADVRVVTSPQLRGYGDLKREACAILARYGAISDLVVFIADADGCPTVDGKPERHNALSNVLNNCKHGGKGVVVIARQELEVWALWGVRTQLRDPWATVVTEPHPKERYFDRVVDASDTRRPGKGRMRLTALSLDCGWPSLRDGCRELAELEKELRRRLDQ